MLEYDILFWAMETAGNKQPDRQRPMAMAFKELYFIWRC